MLTEIYSQFSEFITNLFAVIEFDKDITEFIVEHIQPNWEWKNTYAEVYCDGFKIYQFDAVWAKETEDCEYHIYYTGTNVFGFRYTSNKETYVSKVEIPTNKINTIKNIFVQWINEELHDHYSAHYRSNH